MTTTDTTSIDLGSTALNADFTDQTLTLTYSGFLTGKYKKQLGDIVIPFEEIDRFEWVGKMFVRIILHHWRDDRSEYASGDASDDPLVFQVTGRAQRRALTDMFTSITEATPQFSDRAFARPPRRKGKLSVPVHRFGDISLDGNNIVYKGSTYPIAGATAEVDTGAGGATGLSVGRAVVGGALIGGAGAVLGGTTGEKGHILLGVRLADGRAITTSGSTKQLDAAISLANQIGEWGTKLVQE